MINKITYPEKFYKNYTDACDFYAKKRDEILKKSDEVEAKYGSKRTVSTACLICGVVMTVCCTLGIIGLFIRGGATNVGYVPLRNELFYILLTVVFLVCWLIIRKKHEEKKSEIKASIDELDGIMGQYGFHIISDKDLTIADDWEDLVYLGLMEKAGVTEVDIKSDLINEVTLIKAISNKFSAVIPFDDKAIGKASKIDMFWVGNMLNTADFSTLDKIILFPEQEVG